MLFSKLGNTRHRQARHSINQFFMLFHLAGVSSFTLDNILNFWHDLCRQVQKNHNKNAWNIKFIPPCTARIWDSTPNLNFSANFGTGNTLLAQHLLPDDQDRVCQRFKQNYPKKWPFSHAPPHCTWAPQHMCLKYDQMWSWLVPRDI